ncbi:MAG: hypothetical protein AAFQ84_02275 [Pseudomonadota bacterium]
MRQILKKGLMLTALTTVLAGPSLAQTDQSVQLTEYRIESDDCTGCGAVIIRNDLELRNYLNSVNSAIEARRSANGVFVGPANDGRGSSRRRSRESAQVVFLDFDAGGEPTFPVCNDDGTVFGVFLDHVYTPEERDEITARIAADYADFDFKVVQEAPLDGEFTTIAFGQNDFPLDCSGGSNITVTATGGVSILFGMAEGIDFLNANRADNAFADASFWEFLSQLDPTGGTFEAFSGLSVADFGGDLTAAVSAAVVNQSANTGAHEAGHIQGLRHQNSFGAPGDGIPDTGAILPTDFVPIFDGPAEASETVLHTMASGASVGLSLEGSTITDRFFSERSAVRLAVNEQTSPVEENDLGDDARVILRKIRTPNTIIEGVNADARLRTFGAVVNGAIDELDEVDSFFFFGRKGDFFNAELVSVIGRDLSFEEGIIGQLNLFQINRDGSETLVASNFQSFEAVFDAEIFDAVLPGTGTYRLQVAAPDEFFPFGDETPFPLSVAGAADLLTGEYSVLMFTADKELPRERRRVIASVRTSGASSGR